VKPETVIGWHRQGFRLFWKLKSRRSAGGKRKSPEVVAAIRRIAKENNEHFAGGGTRMTG